MKVNDIRYGLDLDDLEAPVAYRGTATSDSVTRPRLSAWTDIRTSAIADVWLPS